jgi:polyferredoxin
MKYNIENFSLSGLVSQYNKTREKYDNRSENRKIDGLALGLIIFLVILAVVLWIWALVVLVKYWAVLPQWAKVLGILGVIPILPFGPIITLLAVYIGQQEK